MAGTDSKSFPVSLRPWSKEETDTSSDLRDRIARINTQRNGFRNVTEDELLAEIDNGKDDASAADSSETGEGSEDEDEKGTMKAIQKKREEMHRALFQAREEALFSLDSYSLTTTAALPAQGKSTMSPELVNAIPTGSLGFEKWQNMRKDPRKVETENLVWKGSFMTNLTDSADAILAAATRLEKQVKSETEYWRELLSLTSNRWPVYKPQRTNAPLEVRFGAAEAGLEFRSNGVAALRPNEDGSIKLDSRLGGEPKTLRLRLAEDGVVISSSVTATLLSLVDLGASLEDKVRRAQSSLFEEELFQEMAMESRILQPLGVKLHNNVLHLPLSASHDENNTREYLVDLVPLDDASELITNGANENKDLLDAQSILLRLLLCHVYHLRAQKRSQVPPLLSDTQRKEPPSNIVRSFYALNQHFNTCQPFSTFLSSLGKVLSSAGLPISCGEIQTPALHELLESLDSTKSKAKFKDEPTLHLLLDSLVRPHKTSATISVNPSGPSTTTLITLSLITNLSPPLQGSEFLVDLPQNVAQLVYGPEALDRKVTCANLPELKEFMCVLLSMHISNHLLLPKTTSWEAMDQQPVLSGSYSVGGKEVEVKVAVKVSEDKVELRRQRLVGGKSIDSEIWNVEKANGKGLMEVFGLWVRAN